MRHVSLVVSAVSQYLFVDPIVNATRVAGKRLRLLSGGVNEERLRLVSRAGTRKRGLVEARGVEPLSEDRQRTASTCVADNLNSRPPTPVGRLRTAASPESSRPQPLSTGLGPARCIAPFHPRGPQMEERHSLIKLRVPVLDWQLHFPGVLRVPESSTCHG